MPLLRDKLLACFGEKQHVPYEGQTACPFWGTNSMPLLRNKQLALVQSKAMYAACLPLPFLWRDETVHWFVHTWYTWQEYKVVWSEQNRAISLSCCLMYRPNYQANNKAVLPTRLVSILFLKHVQFPSNGYVQITLVWPMSQPINVFLWVHILVSNVTQQKSPTWLSKSELVA